MEFNKTLMEHKEIDRIRDSISYKNPENVTRDLLCFIAHKLVDIHSVLKENQDE